MRKKKLRLFLKIFFLLMIVQLLVGIADILLHNADSSLTSVTSILLTIFSIPLGIISSNLPFYSGEGIIVTLMFWALNLIIQTSAIYVLFRGVKRMRTA